MIQELLDIASWAVRLAERNGAEEAEAFVYGEKRMSITFHEKLEAFKTSNSVGVGIRVAIGRKVGFSSASTLSKQELKKIVKISIAKARATQEDPYWKGLPEKSGRSTVKDVYDNRISRITHSNIMEAVKLVMDTVKDQNRDLELSRGNLHVVSNEKAIVNSYGISAKSRGTLASFYLNVTVEKAGKKGSSWELESSRFWKGIDFEKLAVSTSRRAIDMLNASPIPSGKTNVVFGNKVFANLLTIMFGNTLTAYAVQEGRSPWSGKVGNVIASESFSLIDDGSMPDGMGTRKYDDEGIPQQTTVLVDKGVLRSYLYDTYTAKRDDVISTGNAFRSIGFSAKPFSNIPRPAPTNLILKGSKSSEEELIREAKNGVYVVSTIGEWLSNPISGQLSVTVTNAYKIEKGELTKPVKGIIISGNFFDTIKEKIVLIAKNVAHSSLAYSPSVLVKDLVVAGK